MRGVPTVSETRDLPGERAVTVPPMARRPSLVTIWAVRLPTRGCESPATHLMVRPPLPHPHGTGIQGSTRSP